MMINKILLGFALLLVSVSAAAITSTTSGNYTFDYSTNQMLGERINLAISSSNAALTNGFSCNTVIFKETSIIDNNFVTSIKSGYAQLLINVPIDINDKYQLYNYYNVTSKCVSNQYAESATLNYVFYVEPNPSFNLFINFQLWLIQNGLMVVLGLLFLGVILIVIGVMSGVIR